MKEIKKLVPGSDVSTVIYLPKYKVVVSSHHKHYLMFWNFPDGELLYKFEISKDSAIRNLFTLPDLDMIGASDCKRN